MVYGCGKFSEDAWTALVTAEGESGADHVLSIHLEDCPACKAEFAELSRMGLMLRKALDDNPLAKEAFVASVLSEVSKARNSQRATGRKRSAGARWEREPFLRRLASRPASLAFAAALALVIVGASGLFPHWTGRISVSESTGYTAPGGTILSLSERTEALAAALTTQGIAVAAAAGSQASPGNLESALGPASGASGSTARAIRAPLGIAAAVAQVNES